MADKLFQTADALAESFDKNLFKVLQELDKRVLDVVGGAKVTTQAKYDAATILNSRAEMVKALQDSGYNQLTEEYIKKYSNVPGLVKERFKDISLPPPQFTTADAKTFQQLAAADLEIFDVIGKKAVDDLRLGLYRQAVGGQNFSELVETIRKATVGLDKRGGPLSQYAYTHANTAFLRFSGEVTRVAGESIGAEKWEVSGPDDQVVREACREALANPIRTTEEWKEAGYWGGSPGGWNCRHILDPVIG